MTDFGHWQCNIPIIDGAIGFIYCISNNLDGRKYIGRKLLRFRVSKSPLKGRTNRRRSTKESDFKTYTGSCNELNDDIEKFGKENFSFNILCFCESKSRLSYMEAKYIIDADAIFSDAYYNLYLQLRLRGPAKNKK